jgi:hypothetical protein
MPRRSASVLLSSPCTHTCRLLAGCNRDVCAQMVVQRVQHVQPVDKPTLVSTRCNIHTAQQGCSARRLPVLTETVCNACQPLLLIFLLADSLPARLFRLFGTIIRGRSKAFGCKARLGDSGDVRRPPHRSGCCGDATRRERSRQRRCNHAKPFDKECDRLSTCTLRVGRSGSRVRALLPTSFRMLANVAQEQANQCNVCDTLSSYRSVVNYHMCVCALRGHTLGPMSVTEAL